MDEKKRIGNYIDLADYVCRRYGEMDSETHNWKERWEEVTEYFLPRKNKIYEHTHNTHTRGDRRHNVIDSTGIRANEVFANAMHSMLTNPTIQFFEYSTGNPQLDGITAVRKYLEERGEIIHSLINESNFHTEIHECYLDLGVLGTDVLRVEEDDERIVNFESRPINEFRVKENAYGEIDQVGRVKLMDGHQILSKFGDKWIMDHFKDQFDGMDGYEEMAEDYKYKLIESAKKHERHEVIEFIQPKKIYKLDGMKVKSRKAHVMCYVLKKNKMLIKETGYNERIYSISRLMKSSGEHLGRSFAMSCLGDMMTLNELKKIIIQGAHFNVKPPILIPDDNTYGSFKLFPGAMNFVRPGTSDEIRPFNPNSNHNIGLDLLERLGTDIREAFLNDKLELPNLARTNQEGVRSTRDENLRHMSPILSRQHNEKLVPIIARVDAIAERRGLFDDLALPEELKGNSISINFTSAIARVQRKELAENANLLLGNVINLAQAKEDPTILDIIDEDAYVRYVGFGLSSPSKILRTKAEMEERMEQAKQQQEQQRALAVQQAEAATVKDATAAAQAADGLSTEGLEAIAQEA